MKKVIVVALLVLCSVSQADARNTKSRGWSYNRAGRLVRSNESAKSKVAVEEEKSCCSCGCNTCSTCGSCPKCNSCGPC